MLDISERTMQLKKPKIAPAVQLIGRVNQETMSFVLRYLDALSAGRWEVARTGKSRDGEYFVIKYWPTNRRGIWEVVFGMDGSVWQD